MVFHFDLHPYWRTSKPIEKVARKIAEVQPSASAGSGQRPAPGAEGRGLWLGPSAQCDRRSPSNRMFETHQVIKSTIKTHGFDYIYIYIYSMYIYIYTIKKPWVSPCFFFPKLRSFTQTCGCAPGILRSHSLVLANHFVFPQGISKPGCDVGMAQNSDHPRMDVLIYFDLVC